MCVMIVCNKTKVMQFVTSCFFYQNCNFEPPYSCQNNIIYTPVRRCPLLQNNAPHQGALRMHQIQPHFKNNYVNSASPSPRFWGCIGIFRGARGGHPNDGSCEQGHRFAPPHGNARSWIYTPVRRCPLLQNNAPPQYECHILGLGEA